MGDGDLRIAYLTVPRFSPELSHGLTHEEQTPHPGMGGREPATVGVGGQRASERQCAGCHERTAFALRSEPEILEAHEHGVGERVVHLERVDVGRSDPGFGERPRPGHRAGRHREIGHRLDRVVGHTRCGTAHVHQRAPRFLRPLLGRQHDGATAIGNHATVELVQRIGDEPRCEHVVHGDWISVHGVRVAARVFPGLH